MYPKKFHIRYPGNKPAEPSYWCVIFSLCCRPIGALWLLSPLWLYCCLSDIYIPNFLYQFLYDQINSIKFKELYILRIEITYITQNWAFRYPIFQKEEILVNLSMFTKSRSKFCVSKIRVNFIKYSLSEFLL